MNFTAAANEVFNWLGAHPIDVVLCSVTAAMAIVGVTGKYKDHRENRKRIEAIRAECPDVKPIKLPPLNSPDRFGPR